ncbi:MAG: hypothetical protein COX65_04665 [Elusimicrobia bacterium CG_4_10_14_0_2_um_filter_56_8]|nr:MAG: hypothetical protein AUJ51_01240 [Elusimicrobia bacterium CG1_02_56_21]PJA15109.1 MAG: hypothetical protein COX65_04665 [Elusimicrobia bacterium CG_4_10_14_0_2_um_filter_56_8]
MPRNILVADDDEAMLNIYSRLLNTQDYMVTRASSFAEAARLIEQNIYDLLVTDLMFPDGLGTELIKLLEQKSGQAKSLLVTGSVAELDPVELPKVYFEKPFKHELFMTEVAKALD